MSPNLYDAVNEFDKSQAKQVREYSGLLGLTPNSQTPLVPNRNGYVYVRFRDNQNEIIQAYNETVSPVTNLPVVVIRRSNGWYVKGRDIDRYGDWGSDSAFPPAHHAQHEFNPDSPGGDVVFTYPQQITPLLITPSGTSGGPNVVMQALNFRKSDGSWMQAGITGTPSILAHKPADNTALIGLVYLNRQTGNPGLLFNTGSYAPASTTGTHALLQYLPALPSSDYEPLAMFRMVSGTQSLGWSNLYDIRQWFGGASTGTGGGLSLTANRVVITDDSGTATTDSQFYYDFDTNLLILGYNISAAGNFPALGTNSLHIVGSGTSPAFNLYGIGNSVAPFGAFFRARGDVDNLQAIQHGDVIGRSARFRAHDGANWSVTQGEIRGQALGNWSTGSHGTELVFGITPSGTATMQDFGKINQAGQDILYGTYNISGSPHVHADIPDTGWIAGGVWTRTGNYTFTTTDVLQKGWKVKYRDGGSDEFGVVGNFVAGSPNTVTLITNSDFAMAAATITDNYYSKIENPDGWPDWFNYNCSPTLGAGTPNANVSKFRVMGRAIQGILDISASGTGGITTLTISGPITALSSLSGSGRNINTNRTVICQRGGGGVGAAFTSEGSTNVINNGETIRALFLQDY